MAKPLKPRDKPAKLAAGALATAGVAAGATVAGRRLRAQHANGDGPNGDGRDKGPSRAYQLREGEALGEAMRRMALGRVENALDELSGDGDPAARVHEARKDLKKSRTVARIARDGLGEDRYRADNDMLRDIGRSLSEARDAQVRLETLDELVESDEELRRDQVSGLRASLERDLELEDPEAAAAAVLDDLGRARDRITTWPLEGDDWTIVAGSLRRLYRRGRRDAARAADKPDNENLHEWRKRAKDLWYSVRVFRPTWPELLKPLASETHELADRLGDDHDLAVLAATAREHGSDFDADGLELLLEAIERRRAELQAEARSLGRRLYADKPGAFARHLEVCWREFSAPRS